MTSPPEWTVIDFIHRGAWWRNPSIRVLNLLLLLPLFTASINGLDSSLVNGLQILPAWQDYFDHPNGRTLGLISAAQVIGSIAGLPFTPLSADHLGRKPTLFVGAVIMLAGVALQSAARTIGMFIGARGLIGFGLTFVLGAAPLLITELAYPTQRGKLTSMYNASWYIGSIISAWTCFGAYQGAGHSVWSWRIPTLVQALGPLLQVSFIWAVPESPRFLVAKGRESKAARILARYHSLTHDEQDPLIMFEMAQIRHALKLEKETSKSTSFITLFSTVGNRKRMLIIIALAVFSQWSGNGLVSYYINLVFEGVGIKDAGTKAAINGGLQVWNLIAAMSGALLVDKLGRRTLFIISNVGMLIGFGAWTLTTALFNTMDNKAAAKATIPFIFIFYFFYDIAYTPMLIAYTLEILPFSIRAKGFAVMNLAVSLTLAFNQFVNPWALDALGWKYYLVYCGWLIIELVFVVCYVVETKGRTLEETAALFDGEQQPQVLMQQGGEAATMSRNFAARGPGIWVEQEKSIVADVALRENAPKRVSDRSSASTSMSRYDEERSTHSHSRIYEAI
ncbi:general substrate transporter [Dichomitus squalens]|uniref:General substrate transporter n=1 Tax=Dichomitus squalens TaxID=114155 RepID=A0A4V2K5M4_9APHY|nr:general substrate transporter [Dichomitus squalens LYAD-421 SS1]EJF64973.1 general substrate transporter [Dichomitus squalens LYAD-421 SS1]TBU48883.1 general substrate transporter [Dichomitus squalens]TBU57976.1 general substrate transporter [Dichomitus squalens]